MPGIRKCLIVNWRSPKNKIIHVNLYLNPEPADLLHGIIHLSYLVLSISFLGISRLELEASGQQYRAWYILVAKANHFRLQQDKGQTIYLEFLQFQVKMHVSCWSFCINHRLGFLHLLSRKKIKKMKSVFTNLKDTYHNTTWEHFTACTRLTPAIVNINVLVKQITDTVYSSQ